VSDKKAELWVVKLESVNSVRGGFGYNSDILLKSRIMANDLFCFLCLIVRISEARVSMTNAKGGAFEKV